MFDTHITVVGTALNTPEKKITKNDALVATFRVAARARRFDREKEQWVDGPGFRVRVNCWRRLGEFVHNSIITGDPVVVYGRIVTREWKNEQGEARLAYEVDADAVGHDLSRGRSTFQRWRPEPFGTVVEDADSEARVNGELAENLSGPAREFPIDDYEPAGFGMADGLGDGDHDAMAILREAGLTASVGGEGDGDGDGGGSDDDSDGEGSGDSGSGGSRGRKRGRQPVPA
jgi:single-strand DNA-binding protein